MFYQMGLHHRVLKAGGLQINISVYLWVFHVSGGCAIIYNERRFNVSKIEILVPEGLEA
jgi:hypothetical protein